MNKLHSSLQLQHHRHTGRVLHHRHTSYRGLAVVIGLAGLFITGLNVVARVTADSLFVYATVPAPTPTTAATISTPSDGTLFSTTDVLVSGSCEVLSPAIVIQITDNGANTGSTSCDSGGNFSITVSLLNGTHSLVAKSSSITNGVGPDSAAVHITLQVPIPPAQPSPTGSSATNPPSTANPPSSLPGSTTQTPAAATTPTSPLVVDPDEQFIVYGPAKDAVWTGTIRGGKAPYTVRIWWGDGTMNTYLVTEGGQRFRHHFKTMQSYDTYMTVTDSDTTNGDNTPTITKLHIAVVTPYVPPSIGGTTSSGGGLFGTTLGPSSLVGVYGSYLLVLALFGALWVRSHGFAYAKVPAKHRHKPAAKRYVAAKKRRRKPEDRSR